jgi:hypothetical protein
MYLLNAPDSGWHAGCGSSAAPARDEAVFDDFQSISSWTTEDSAAKLNIWASELVLVRSLPGT